MERIKSFENTIGISGDIKGYRPLVVYPYDSNIEWGGDFHNGITWSFSLRNGTNIGGDIKVDDQELELINKIKQYGDIWKNEWAKKLRTDYKVQSSDSRNQLGYLDIHRSECFACGGVSPIYRIW
jgi:hypothetical protein